MNKLIILILIFSSLCGCAKVISERDQFVTISHGVTETHFSNAYEKAQEYCSAKGLTAKKTSTDCPSRCVSEFECVE